MVCWVLAALSSKRPGTFRLSNLGGSTFRLPQLLLQVLEHAWLLVCRVKSRLDSVFFQRDPELLRKPRQDLELTLQIGLNLQD